MSQTTGRRRGRPRRMESYADWMARIDSQVEAAASKMERPLPAEKLLTAEQRRILQMLAEHMRNLPQLNARESPFEKTEYKPVNRILVELFSAKYPNWTERISGGFRDVDKIPNGEAVVFERLLRNCAGRAPAELADNEEEED